MRAGAMKLLGCVAVPAQDLEAAWEVVLDEPVRYGPRADACLSMHCSVVVYVIDGQELELGLSAACTLAAVVLEYSQATLTGASFLLCSSDLLTGVAVPGSRAFRAAAVGASFTVSQCLTPLVFLVFVRLAEPLGAGCAGFSAVVTKSRSFALCTSIIVCFSSRHPLSVRVCRWVVRVR